MANFLSFHVTQAKFSLSRKGDSLVSQFQHTTCIPYRHRAPLARELHAWPGLCLPQDPPCRCKSWCLGHSQLQNLSRQNLSAQKDFFSKAKLPKLYSSLKHYQSLIQRQILRWCTNFCKSGQQGIQKGPDFRQLSLLESEGPGVLLLSTRCMQKPQKEDRLRPQKLIWSPPQPPFRIIPLANLR